jgi:hypothetical protein
MAGIGLCKGERERRATRRRGVSECQCDKIHAEISGLTTSKAEREREERTIDK